MVHILQQPDWAPVFHGLIRRLTDTTAVASRHFQPAPDAFDADFDAARFADEPGDDDAAENDVADFVARDAGLMGGDEIDTLVDQMPPVLLRGPHGPSRPHVVMAMASLRLAMMLDDPHCLHAPGAVTLLQPGSMAIANAMGEIITRAVVPASMVVAMTVTGIPPHLAASGRVMLVLSPTAETLAGQKTFAEAIRTTLARTEPCVILLPDGFDLPLDLEAVLPRALVPPALDRAALRPLMAVLYPAETRSALEAALGTLPEAAPIARLPLEALSLAFRAPDPKGAVAVLIHQMETLAQPPRPTAALDQFDASQLAVRAARQMVADLAAWRAGQLAWSDIPNGLLVTGPPGTGKTWLARAIAAEAGVEIIETAMTDWQEGSSLGPMLAKMRASFDAAQRAAPCVLFIDELDAAGTRSERNHNSSYNDQTMAALLTGLTELREVEGVLVVGATNRGDGIDPALVRPGRFDLTHPLQPPTLAGVKTILTTLLARDGLGEGSRDLLAAKALGLSPAAIQSAVRKARAACRNEGKTLSAAAVGMALTEGFEVPQDLRLRIALHEAGHAAVGMRLGQKIERITLGRMGGKVDWIPQPGTGTVAEFAAQIAVTMAGRAAEEVLLGNPSGGAGGPEHSDLAIATRTALELEVRHGLGSSGLLWRGASPEALLMQPTISARVEAHLADGLATAKAVIAGMPRLVEALAEVLLREHEISGALLGSWTTVIRDYDPHIEDLPAGSVVVFPRRNGNTTEPGGPQSSA